jgi:hypothetical protein
MTFGFNIPLETKLFIDTFEKATKRQSNQTALDFLKFYKCEFNSLAKTPVGRLMLGERDAAMHRIPSPLSGHFSVYIQESLNFDEKISDVKTNKDGKIRLGNHSVRRKINERTGRVVGFQRKPNLQKVSVYFISSKNRIKSTILF